MWNNRYGLIEPDPNAGGERTGVTEKPRVFVIVGCAGFASRRQAEAQ